MASSQRAGGGGGWPVCGPKNRAAEGEKLTRCNGAAVACLAFPKPLVAAREGRGGPSLCPWQQSTLLHRHLDLT